MPFGVVGGLLGAAITAGSNAAIANTNNQAAAEREAIARNENYLYNEKAAKAADARTRALYNDLYSPSAQLQQLKDAGLSPSLFYGDGGGISGQTGAQGAGAAGVGAQSFGIPPMDFAEIGKIIAETNLIKAQTDEINGTTPKAEAEIKNIIADTNNKMLKGVYQEYQNALAEIDLTVEASTQNTKIENYIAQTKYLKHQIGIAATKEQITKESKDDVLAYIKGQTNNIIADTLLKKVNAALTKENINLSKEQALDLANQITNRDKMTQVNEETLNAQIEQWGKENGLKEQQIKVMRNAVIVQGIVGGTNAIMDLVKLSFGLGGATKVVGL